MTTIKLAALAAAFGFAASTAHATQLQITIDNTGPMGGLSLTPLFAAFHDGTANLFDSGAAASAGVELIAETGFADVNDAPAGISTAGVVGELAAMQSTAQSLQIGSPDGPPPIEPGETASATFDVDGAVNQFFSFLSMVLPSNDTFVGNDQADLFRIFAADGSFLGPLTIVVTGAFVYDAGSEANDLAVGSAFVQGVDIFESPTGEGTIAQGLGLGENLENVLLATGIAFNPDFADFTSNPGGFTLATIKINAVPLPLSGLLLLTGLAGLGAVARRRKA